MRAGLSNLHRRSTAARRLQLAPTMTRHRVRFARTANALAVAAPPGALCELLPVQAQPSCVSAATMCVCPQPKGTSMWAPTAGGSQRRVAPLTQASRAAS